MCELVSVLCARIFINAFIINIFFGHSHQSPAMYENRHILGTRQSLKKTGLDCIRRRTEEMMRLWRERYKDSMICSMRMLYRWGTSGEW